MNWVDQELAVLEVALNGVRSHVHDAAPADGCNAWMHRISGGDCRLRRVTLIAFKWRGREAWPVNRLPSAAPNEDWPLQLDLRSSKPSMPALWPQVGQPRTDCGSFPLPILLMLGQLRLAAPSAAARRPSMTLAGQTLPAG